MYTPFVRIKYFNPKGPSINYVGRIFGLVGTTNVMEIRKCDIRTEGQTDIKSERVN